MTHKFSDEDARGALELTNGSVPDAAAHLGVHHTTLWRYLKETLPDAILPRRARAYPSDAPDSLCLALYMDRVLRSIPFANLVEQHDLSAHCIRALIRRGRDLYNNSARFPHSSPLAPHF